MAAICHPEAQKRVQDELDSVVGRGRRESESTPHSFRVLPSAILCSPDILRPELAPADYGFRQ